MSSFGPRLKREREMRGITLDDIAESTKIGKRSLQALEDENFNQLPGGIFNKGFVRAYAKYLGLDEEQAVADYLEAENAASTGKRSVYVEPVVEKIAEAKGVKTEKSKAKESANGRSQAKEEEENQPPLNPDPTANRIWMLVAVLLLIGLFFAWRALVRHNNEGPKTSGSLMQTPEASTPADKPAAQSGSNTNTSGPSATTEQEAAITPQNPMPANTADSIIPANVNPLPASGDFKGVVVQVMAVEDAWIQVTSDGKVVMDGVMLAKTEREFRANNTMTLKTGNAGGVQVSQNGKTYGILGREKQVRTVSFTSQGMQNQP